MGKSPSMDWVTCKLHSLMQGVLRWSASYGHTHLRPSEIQKSKLMDQALTLFLYRYPSLVSSDRLGSQAWEFLFGHIPSPEHNHELDL
jgi:hypothetical protein